MVTALLLAAALQTAAPMNSSPDLTVVVDGVRDGAGHVHVDLCTSDQFLGKHCFASGEARARPGQTRVVIHDVPPGVYAVQAFQDRNDNGRVDRGALGVPTEDVGFSGNVRLGLGHRPTFSLASFSHNWEDQAVLVRLKHFF